MLSRSIIYMSSISRKYIYFVSKNDKNKEVYKVILQACFVILTLSIYGIVLIIKYYRGLNQVGTFRELLEGNIVIRDVNESNITLQNESSTVVYAWGSAAQKNLKFSVQYVPVRKED